MAAVGSEDTLITPRQPLYQPTSPKPSLVKKPEARQTHRYSTFATFHGGQAKGSEGSGLTGNKRNQEEEED